MVKADTQSINEIVAMGFTIQQAQAALEKYNNDKEEALNYILTGGDSLTDFYQPEDKLDDLNKAIEISMQDAPAASNYSFDPISPEDRVRVPGVPVGLKNVGNTCYFNSLLQAYFMVPKFVRELLSFREASTGLEDAQQNSQSASLKLVRQLQRLFTAMICSHRRYIDPSNVLEALVDDLGNPILIGDQKDVGEFNMVLAARIEHGMKPPLREDAKEDENPQQAQLPIRKDSTDRQSSRQRSLSYSMSVPDEDTISALFYGQQVEFIKSSEADGTQVVQHQEVIFGQLSLDVDERDIYSAWDKTCYNRIEGYVTPQGFSTSADQEVWLTRLPKMLLFQIQRIYFDSATQSNVKKHSFFRIDKVIYPDRFLYANKHLVSMKRSQVHALKVKVADLEATLAKYERFANDSLSIDRVLLHAQHFLSEQIESQKASGAGYHGLETSCNILGSFASYTGQMIEQLKAELKEVNEAIDRVFDQSDIKQNPYNLHSILVHDGMAGSGQYYAFIYDSQTGIWRKYSDISVTEVSEEEVFKRSSGGSSMASAYCLIYIAANMDEEYSKILRAYAVSEDPLDTPDLYSSYIPADLRREVDEDNVKLRQEIEDYRSNQLVMQVKDIYLSRYTTADSQSMSFRNLLPNSPEGRKFELINLPIFLKVKYEDKLCKQQLFEQVVKEVLRQDLSELDKSSALYAKLTDKLLKSHRDMPFNLTLSSYEAQKLEKFTVEFLNNLRDASYTNLAMRAMLQKDFDQAFDYLKYETSRIAIEINFFQRMPRELIRVAVYYLMTAVNISLQRSQFDKATIYSTQLVNWTTEFFEKYCVEYRQVLMSFKRACAFIEANGLTDIREDFLDKFRALDNEKPISRRDTLMPPEFMDLHQRLEQIDPKQWIEGWRTDGLASKFIESMKLVKDMYQPWYNISIQLTSRRSPLSEADLYEFEVSVAALHNSP